MMNTTDTPPCPACGSPEPDCDPGCPAVPERETPDLIAALRGSAAYQSIGVDDK